MGSDSGAGVCAGAREYWDFSKSSLISGTLPEVAGMNGLSAKSEPSAEYDVDGREFSSSKKGWRRACMGAAFTRSVIRSK